jgi:probable HAF family extracellular repeat protein
MVDLNTLISNKVTLEYASGINDQGQIVGTGLFNNSMHAFLLTPAPKGTPKAQPAISTPPGTIAGPTSVPGSDTYLAAVLARSTSDSTDFGPTTVSVGQPIAPSPGQATPSAPSGTWVGVMPAARASSPSLARATDVGLAGTHTDAKDDGDWLTTALFLDDQEAR